MKIHNLEQKSNLWLSFRKGKIGGSDVKRIIGSKTVRDSYFYEVLAERLAIDDGSQETALERGERLEDYAIQAFEKETGNIVEKIGITQHDEIECITCSPDGLIKKRGKYVEAVETKCLSSANHIRAWLENEVPKDYFPQVIQYFIVNDHLKKLYFVLFDPRISVHPLHIIEVERKDIEDYIAKYLEEEQMFINEVEEKLSEILKI